MCNSRDDSSNHHAQNRLRGYSKIRRFASRVAKATLLVLDEETIAFANIRSPGTVENLRRHPSLEVNFIDVFARTGCRVRGRACYVLRDDADTNLRMRFQSEWADLYPLIQGIVVIAITQAEALSSPLYDVGAIASQVGEHWLRDYATALGFAVTKKSDGAAESGYTKHSLPEL